jgi:hypothetical protein
MNDPTFIGWVIFGLVISAVILTATLETTSKVRSKRRRAFRHAIQRLATVKKKYQVPIWRAGEKASDKSRDPSGNRPLKEDLGPLPFATPQQGPSIAREAAIAGTEAVTVVALAETLTHHTEQIKELIEALTRLLVFDTESILFAPGQDWLLKHVVDDFHWAEAHASENIRHLLRHFEELKKAAHAVEHFSAAHESTPHLHSLAEVFPHAAEHIPTVALTIPAVSITIVFFKETMLLLEEKTTIDRMIQHVMVQAGSIAVCGFVGKKAGVTIGFFVGGVPGAIVGAFVGAVAGALAGKSIANAVNRAAFESACAEYENDYKDLCRLTDEALVRIQHDQQEAMELLGRAVGEKIRQAREQMLNDSRQLDTRRQDVIRKFCSSFPEVLDRIREAQLRHEKRYLDACRITWFDRLIGRSPRARIAERIRRIFERSGQSLEELKLRYNGIPENQKWEFISALVEGANLVHPLMAKRLAELRFELQQLIDEADQKVKAEQELERQTLEGAQSTLTGRMQQIFLEGREVLEPAVNKIRGSKAAMIREGESLGYDFGASPA